MTEKFVLCKIAQIKIGGQIKIFRNIFFVMILFFATTIFFTGCGEKDSPEKALSEMQNSLEQKDFEKLSERTDLEKFFSQTYDDVTVELVKHYDEFGKLYPEDPYFQHSAEFLKKYNSDHRDLHLKFLREVADAYFKKIPEPENPEKNPYAYVANEFEKIRLASNAVVKDIKLDGEKAFLTIEMQGDNSIRGQFIGNLIFKFSFDKDKNNIWHFNKVENLDELTPILVDKAEKVWITFYN